MKIEPLESDWVFAKSVYNEFSLKLGAQHIASEFALAHLSAVLNEVKPDAVLEFGAGIGTITYFLLKHPAKIGHVTTTENNEFCLEQFSANFPADDRGRYNLIVDHNTLVPGQRPYDLVIVDDKVSQQGYAYLDHGMTCFIEGARSVSRQEIQRDSRPGAPVRFCQL